MLERELVTPNGDRAPVHGEQPHWGERRGNGSTVRRRCGRDPSTAANRSVRNLADKAAREGTPSRNRVTLLSPPGSPRRVTSDRRLFHGEAPDRPHNAGLPGVLVGALKRLCLNPSAAPSGLQPRARA
jgi:hypothetical protein